MQPEQTISSWQDLEALRESLDTESDQQWIFRGQRDSRWQLTSSLERVVCQRFRQPIDRLGDWEQWLLSEFRRHGHRYLKTDVDPGDILRCLALMQHHGAPTRLVDFTYSFYVGLYFAIEDADPDTHCAIWAVDASWCWNRTKEELEPSLRERIEADQSRGKTPSLQAELLATTAQRVVPDNSFFLDERVSVQQGVFLIPLDLTKPFMDNLRSDSEAYEEHVHLYEISCTVDFLRDAFARLQRVNINRESLFPGLDGFAQGLHARIAFSDPLRCLGVAEHAV